MILLLVSVVLVLALLISWITLVRESNRFNVQGPTPLPLVGNAHLFVVKSSEQCNTYAVKKEGTADFFGLPTIIFCSWGLERHAEFMVTVCALDENLSWISIEFLNLIQRLSVKYGLAFRVHIFSTPVVMICHSKYAEPLVSSTEHNKRKAIRLPDLLARSRSPHCHGWKTHRKFLTPAFHFNILQNFLPVFCKNQHILTEKLRGMADGRPIDMVPVIALAALDNVTESIMGVCVNAQQYSESEYVKSIEELSAIVTMRIQIPILGEDAIFNLLPYKTKQDKALKILHGQTNKVINARREELKKANITTLNDSSDIGIKNKHAFLDLLLLAEIDGKKIDDESVREEVDTFMFEGHDTTTSGIVYTLYCLSKRRDVQEKIYEELKTIFGSEMSRDPTYHELHQMKYLELVIKESMRLFPPVPIIERRIMKDCEVGGLKLLKGTSVVVNIYQIQRQPDLFDDPLEFRPERFEAPLKNPFSWLAFSAGPRNCIGQKFAMMELKITISEIVKNFFILPAAQEPELSADLVLRSKNGVNVKFMPRK